MEYEFYGSHCRFEGDGEISTEEGDVVWQLTTPRRGSIASWFFPYGLSRDPGCCLTKTGEDERLWVRRERQSLQARFAITREDELLATITQQNLLRNRYSIEFARGATWVFHMPLFAIHFQGVCDTGRVVQVREWSKRQWYIRVEEGHNEPILMCALAVIHRERLRCG